MQQSIKILRPATVALAVALAGSAAPAWAQDATVAPPPVVTTAPAPAPVAAPPVAVTPPPIAQTVAPDATTSRTTINAEAAAAAEADRPAPRRAEAAPVRAAPVERAAAAPVRAAPPAAEPVAAPVAPVTTAEAPATQPAAPAVTPQANDPAAMAAATAPAEPAVAENTDANGGMPLSWLLGGLGGLVVVGLIAAMLLRRRQEAEYQEVHAHPELAAAPVAEPVALRPAPVAATASPALATGPVRTADGRMVGRHEALAMQGASENNPFLTMKNRLKRARFFDRQERVAGLAQRPAMPFDAKPATAPVREAGVVRSKVAPSRQSFGWPGAPRPAMG